MKIGVSIPLTYICDWNAYQAYLAKDNHLEAVLANEIKHFIEPRKAYAVRSSANIEDSVEYSFSGQFETILNVKDLEGILHAIHSVWGSAHAPNVLAYTKGHNIPDSEILMAVLIQEMIDPTYAGVAMSKNPVTGADEIIVEAIQGEGTRLVQEGLTPERWVNKWGFWLEKNECSKIPFMIIQQIVDEVNDIATRVGYPVDMEWVYDGQTLYWLQLREITTIKKRKIYSNHLAREMMPGMIKPLSFQISAPLMSEAVLGWLSEVTGKLEIPSQDMVKSFYYRTYFNMGAIGKIFTKFGFPAESFEMLMGVLPRGAGKRKIKPTLKTFSRLPGILIFLIKTLWFRNKLHSNLDRLKIQLHSASKENLTNLDPLEILQKVNCHKQQMCEIAYATTLSLFLLSMYNRALERQLARRGIKISNFDLTENMPELQNYYPSSHLQQLHTQYRSFPTEIQDSINNASYQQLQEMQGVDDFLEKFESLIDLFGHMGDSGNDFSIPPWRETPDMLLKMVTDFKPPDKDHTPKVRLSDLKARRQITPLFQMLYNRAREFQLLREQASNIYTQGKIMFRDYYLAIAQHFVRLNLLDIPDDIFYLTPAQVEQLATAKTIDFDSRALVAQHKSDMERYRDIQLPTVIYGDEPPPIRDSSTKILVGVSTSMGYYTGRVCVVKSIQDFPKLKQGEVLVIPHSDVSWAPLFARAGAIISESGGLLSHCSIVAREYGIPAIVSVELATSIPDGTLVTVDAHQGIVQLLD